MASKYPRGEGPRPQWWVKFTHPRTGACLRMRLETRDKARAELLRKRLECELALLRLAALPAFSADRERQINRPSAFKVEKLGSKKIDEN